MSETPFQPEKEEQKKDSLSSFKKKEGHKRPKYDEENRYEDHKKRLKKHVHIRHFLPTFFEKSALKKGFVSTDLITSWRDIVDEDLANVSLPVRCSFPRGEKKHGTLYIKCAPAAGLSIMYQKSFILDVVNRYFGYDALCDIKTITDHDFFKNEENKKKKAVYNKKTSHRKMPYHVEGALGEALQKYYNQIKV